MPDQKISADPLITSPTTQARLAGIDHGKSTTTNYQFDPAAIKSWIQTGASDLSATGTRDATTYLRGDNTWATPAGGGSVGGLVTTTTNRTFILSDASKTIEGNSASALTFTVPTNASVPYPIDTILTARQVGVGQITFGGSTGVVLRTPTTRTTRTQWSEVSIKKRATDEWVVAGDTT